MKIPCLITNPVTCFMGLLLVSCTTFAQDESNWSCINSNSQKMYLVDQFNTAKKTSAISEAIYKVFPKSFKDQTEASAPAAEPCIGCAAAQLKFPTDNVESIKQFMLSGSRLDVRCLMAARQFSASAPEINCPTNVEVKAPAIYTGIGKSRKIAEAKGACITLPMLDYQSTVIANLYNCFRKHSKAPVAPSTFFEIMSRESTFRPNYSDPNSGHGAGQLTKPFVDDIQQSWRGRPTLEAIAKDATPECEAASKIAKIDLTKNYQLGRDRCEFIQYGSGLERSTLWMMIGLDTLWRKNLNPRVAQYLTKYKNHPKVSKVMEKLLQVGYGRGGPGGMGALFSHISQVSPDRALAELTAPFSKGEELNPNSLVAYSREIADRQNEIATKYLKDDPELQEKFLKEGAEACIK